MPLHRPPPDSSGTETVLNALSQEAPLSSADLALVEARLTVLEVNKGERYQVANARNNGLGFLETGLMRSFYVTADGDEVTSGFFERGVFVSDLGSYLDGTPAERTMEAVTDCRVWQLAPDALDEVRRAVDGWPLFEQRYISALLKAKADFQRRLIQSDTDGAYALFLERFPHAAAFAPRYQIASFLGMSPFTLSRKRA